MAVIHYHGGPVTPVEAAVSVWTSRHAFVSYEHPAQIGLAAEVCQSFALDNGAFSAWKRRVSVDWSLYREWVAEWGSHPGCDFAVIPDVITGNEAENDDLIAWWQSVPNPCVGVPVWHLHESVERLQRLCLAHRRVALGSSGDFSDVGTDPWWQRMGEAMDAICDDRGLPPAKLHGLRMLDPTVFSQLPLSSADSTNIARNIGIDQAWRGGYAPMTKMGRALVMADRIEHHASAPRWTMPRPI